MSGSIGRRLLLSSALLVFAFLGLAGLSLDAAFRESSQQALWERLQAHVYTLLAAAGEDPDSGLLRMPQNVPAPEMNRPDSGLYATVSGESGGYLWRSGSLLGKSFPAPPGLAIGATRRSRQADLWLLHQAIGWDDFDGRTQTYVLSIGADRAPLLAEQRQFRQTLWAWLGGVGLLLLLTQLGLVRWGLRPLHRIAEQVRRVEAGGTETIAGPVPRELLPLTENLNSLIAHGIARQQRLRHSLADLAHSLKTPLSVLRGAARDSDGRLATLIEEHSQRIDELVSYHRQRAAVAGNTVLHPPLPVLHLVQRIAASLHKVHRERSLDCLVEVAEDYRLRVDQGDLFELLGNLMENAFKHARSQVRVSAVGVQLVVEDDGAGIPPHQVERLLQRGQRADQRHPGEGIGLAVVDEIVRQYDGRLDIDKSPLGGARITVKLG